jgi:hypothetical protein
MTLTKTSAKQTAWLITSMKKITQRKGAMIRSMEVKHPLWAIMG